MWAPKSSLQELVSAAQLLGADNAWPSYISSRQVFHLEHHRDAGILNGPTVHSVDPWPVDHPGWWATSGAGSPSQCSTLWTGSAKLDVLAGRQLFCQPAHSLGHLLLM
jgi:hypothetical protein